jgi:hypothetical protein
MWDMGGLNIAVPKKRGSGYLKQPYGHHAIQALDDIAADERIAMCGLDGYLNLEYRYVEYDARAAIIDRVMPRLAAHYGFREWMEDETAFWAAVEAFRHNADVHGPRP